MVTKVSFQQKEQQRNYIAFSILGTLSLTVFNSLFLILLAVNYNSLASKPTPRLVELTTGETMPVNAIGSLDRKPETIKKFTKDIFTLMFTWTGHIKGANGQNFADPGVKITSLGNKKLPTVAWESSFALSANYRREFLKYLFSVAPSEAIFNDSIDVVFVPVNISNPVQLKEGHWQINLVSNLLVIKNRETRKIIPFNKKIFIKAVEPPDYKHIPSDNAHSAIVGIISAIRQPGLEIEKIEDLMMA